MAPRKCRMRQLLNKITTSDKIDLQATCSSIKVANSVLRDLQKLDQDSSGDCIKHVDETFMDVQIYNAVSNTAYECISNINYKEYTFDPNDFVDKLRALLSNNNPEEYTNDCMRNLGNHMDIERILPTMISAPALHCVPIDVPAPVKEKVARNAKEPPPEKKRLIKVTQEEAIAKEKSNNNLPNLYYKCLNEEYNKGNKAPISYFQFTLDSESFSQTVENIFYVSFLLNEGRATVFLDDNNKPMIEPFEKQVQGNGEDAQLAKHQMVSSVSYELWESLIKQYQRGIFQHYMANKTRKSS